MYNLKNYLEDLCKETGLKFDLISDDGKKIFESLDSQSEDKMFLPIHLGKAKATLCMDKSYESCSALLKYSIESKYKELYSLTEQSVIEILEGTDVSLDKIERNISFITKGCNLLLLTLDGSRYEALHIIKQIYDKQEIVSINYKNDILILGVFNEIEEHAKSIQESITSDLYCDCYISYGEKVYDIEGLRRAYNEAKEGMELGRKYKIKHQIFNYEKLLFEKIIYNIDDKVKEELLNRFKDIFNSFDKELIITIEEFINSDLNISSAAKKLYIHRNTLIYRLDKIQKETGYDIRNFKEATVFIITFLVWKEYK